MLSPRSASTTSAACVIARHERQVQRVRFMQPTHRSDSCLPFLCFAPRLERGMGADSEGCLRAGGHLHRQSPRAFVGQMGVVAVYRKITHTALYPMRWFRKKPLPAIPPFQPPIEVKPVPKEEPSVIVEEGSLSDVGIDVESLTRTGVHKAWNRFTGRPKG